MADQTTQLQAEWPGFDVQSSDGGIKLRQLDHKHFRLESTVRYTGEKLGVEEQWFERFLPSKQRQRRHKHRAETFTDDTCTDLRIVESGHLPSTDLASVPPLFRWWINTYGGHTPAALIHDRFIGGSLPAGVDEAQIDRNFRFMLRGSGEPYLRSWLVWAAVALRTRLHRGGRRKVAMVVWILSAVAGVATATISLATFSWFWFCVAALAPIGACALWGKQAGAGLIIAYVGVPCLLLPALLAIPALLLYSLFEAFAHQVLLGHAHIRSRAARRMLRDAKPQEPLFTRLSRTWLSTRSHPRHAIADKHVLQRYQRNRSIIAAAGTLLGAIGLGVSMSSSGQVDTDPFHAFGWPLLAGAFLALFFIRVPTPRLVRSLIMLGIGLYLLTALDVPWEWKITMGVVGFVLSWIIAQAIRFWLGVGKHTARGMKTALLSLPLVLATAIVFTDQPPAAAQVASCGDGELTLQVDGQQFGDERIDVVVENRQTSVIVEAASSLSTGTIIVELVGTEPVPMAGVGPQLVWSGQLDPTADGGATGPQEIEIRRGGRSDRFVVESIHHAESFDLVAGSGKYRATAVEPNGTTCFVEGWVRIIVSPAATTTGRIALASALVGLAAFGGSVAGGGSPDPDDGFQPIGPVSIRATRTVKHSHDTRSETRWTTKIKVRVDEKEAEREGATWRIEDVSLGKLVRYSGSVDLSTGFGEIPLEFTDDPGEIDLEVGSLVIDLTGNDQTLTEATLILGADGVSLEPKMTDSANES